MKKAIIIAVALVCVLALGIGGSIAWISATTDKVVNTFTIGDIDLTLDEPNWTDKQKFVPGDTKPKDPTVTVSAGSESCYVFIKVENTVGFFDLFDNLAIDTDNWAKVTGITDNVYVYVGGTTAPAKVDASAAEKELAPLMSNITLKGGITEEQYKTVASANISFTAYAIQSANVTSTTAADIWSMLNNQLTANA